MIETREQKTYNVEEHHRGKWIPLMVADKNGKEKQKIVRTLKEYIETQNMDAEAQVNEKNRTSLFRYVLCQEKAIEKKMSRQDMLKFCKENGISIKPTDKNKDLEEKIKNFK